MYRTVRGGRAVLAARRAVRDRATWRGALGEVPLERLHPLRDREARGLPGDVVVIIVYNML